MLGSWSRNRDKYKCLLPTRTHTPCNRSRLSTIAVPLDTMPPSCCKPVLDNWGSQRMPNGSQTGILTTPLHSKQCLSGTGAYYGICCIYLLSMWFVTRFFRFVVHLLLTLKIIEFVKFLQQPEISNDCYPGGPWKHTAADFNRFGIGCLLFSKELWPLFWL